VRSNAAVIVKNKSTLGIGTGEQDRVGAVEQAIEKYNTKYKGHESIKDAVMVTDGYCPFPDVVEVAADNGVSAIVMVSGSVKDYEVVKAGNDRGVAILFAPERCFTHH
jgi:phosphoribosylaminoimidazolecarboxamide formyltransferase/IMP cyclohydrolase